MRLALVTGIAIGYVLGTRAGTERYEQLRNAWNALRKSPPAEQLSHQVSDSASKAGQALKEKAAAGVSKGTEKLKGRAGNGQPPSWPTNA